jgi:heme/copper-type cytochrome/quinol oxidase subunit 1
MPAIVTIGLLIFGTAGIAAGVMGVPRRVGATANLGRWGHGNDPMTGLSEVC